MPTMTKSETLVVSEFCSEACREWLVNAVATAQNDDPNTVAAVERHSQRLFLIGELLNLRDNPADMTFFTMPTESLAVSDAGS